MSADKTRAERLAGLLLDGKGGLLIRRIDAAAELRRLSDSEAALIEALEEVASFPRHPDYDWPIYVSRGIDDLIAKTKEARNA